MSIPDFAKVTRGEGFSRDFKKLIKRYRSLEEDLKVFIRAQLFAYHKLQVDNHGLFPIDNLGIESPNVSLLRSKDKEALTQYFEAVYAGF
jgi:hypothetical protein